MHGACNDKLMVNKPRFIWYPGAIKARPSATRPLYQAQRIRLFKEGCQVDFQGEGWNYLYFNSKGQSPNTQPVPLKDPLSKPWNQEVSCLFISSWSFREYSTGSIFLNSKDSKCPSTLEFGKYVYERYLEATFPRQIL